jgi:hypothetical protein
MTPVSIKAAPGGAAVFICYRRDDAAGYAGRLHDYLVSRLGGRRIFMDIDTLRPGEDFHARIEEAIESAAVVVALVGKRWAGELPGGTARRIDDTDDFVRLELAHAFATGRPVIPVLLQDAHMAMLDPLPEPLRPLSRLNAIALHDTSWNADVQRLVAEIERLIGVRSVKRTVTLLGASALVLFAVIGLGLFISKGLDRGAQPSPSAASSVAGAVTYDRLLSETFSDASRFRSYGACQFTVRDGVLRARVTGLFIFCQADTASYPGLSSLGDVRVDADAAWAEGVGGDPTYGPGEVGLSCRVRGFSGSNDGYDASFSPVTGYYELTRYDVGKQRDLRAGSSASLVSRPGQARHLRLECTGQAPVLIVFIVDGEEVFSYTDSNGLGPGSVAMSTTSFVGTVEGQFDNLVVSARK